ncbi:MAG: AAA family ATPase [Alphaproteobacteria bacterium]|nr:AAA family ATPase [Alphaproteobacteria bacterium]
MKVRYTLDRAERGVLRLGQPNSVATGGATLSAQGVAGGVAPDGGLPLVYFTDINANLDAADFVEGLLTEGGMSVTYGESNCGKTFFMTDLALHVAAGMEWNGRAVEEGGVIYCALEGSHGISNRVTAWRKHHQMEGLITPFAIIPISINLLDPAADTERLIQAITKAQAEMEKPVRLVVLDTLSRALSGGNENAPDDMGALVANIDRVRQATGAHVNGVHHSGKDTAKGARGHSLLRAATDTEIEITRATKDSPSIATVKKQRDLEIEGEWIFKLTTIELGRNRRGKPVTSCIITPADPKEAKPTGPKLNMWQAMALQALKDAIGERGEMGFGNLPRVKMVGVDTWRAKWWSRASIEPDNKKRATWARSKDRILLLKIAAHLDDKVWLIQEDSEEGRQA